MYGNYVKQDNPLKLLLDFQRDPYYFFDRVKPDKTKEIKRLRLGFKNFYFCYHPDHAKYILQDRKDNYPKSSLVLKKILPLSGPQGLIQLDDSKAKLVRKAAGRLMDSAHSHRLSQRVEGFVREEYPSLDRAAREGTPVNLKSFLTNLVLRTAGIFILNHDIQVHADRLNHAFVELNRMSGESLRSLFPNPFSLKKRKYLKIIHSELDKIIEERLRAPGTSLLHKLAKDDFSKAFIRDQVKAFMFAGYDTTASSLIFAVDSVARSARVQDKIYGERHLMFNQALFTQATYKESLRLYPSAYFLPRESVEEEEIFGQKIQAGAQIFLSIRHIHRHPEVYKKPNEFRPERFLEKLVHSHAFIPFGGGTRICIGAPLAMMEATVVLQKLCERYLMKVVSAEAPKIEGLITAHPTSALYVTLKRRSRC